MLSLEATEERLTLLVEDRFDIHTWRGDFTSKYLEEITRKTGKERSYATFLQMLIGTIRNERGFSQFYIDLMSFQELQLLKARRAGDAQASMENSLSAKNNKRYLILTHLINAPSSNPSMQQKVHYPLPLNPVETGTYLMDKETMKRMVQRMSQTLTEFRTQPSSQNQSNGFSQNLGMASNGFGRQTAKEFFSKENTMHPVVEENQALKKKLQQLEQAKVMGGAVSLNTLHVEKKKIEGDFQSYQAITQKEIKRLKNLQMELQKRINDTKVEIQSERPQSAFSQLSIQGGPLQNQTMTSNFNTGDGGLNPSSTAEMEDLRRQLAEVSVELEETREQYKRRLALQQKDMNEYYEQLTSFRNEERMLRVKVNQIEVELERNLKRLDIICKSKGLPKPVRKFSATSNGSAARGGASYVSPYRRQGPGSNNGSATRPGQRNLSNYSGGSGVNRPSPLRNFQYTPPNKRLQNNRQSPSAFSNGSNNSLGSKNKFAKGSPMSNTGGSFNNQSASLRNRQQSPGARSIGSNKSGGAGSTQNRLYSPSGRMRNGSGNLRSPGLYGSGATTGGVNAGANRVRREPAVGGSPNNLTANSFNSRGSNNSRTRSTNSNNGYGSGNANSSNLNRNKSGNQRTTGVYGGVSKASSSQNQNIRNSQTGLQKQGGPTMFGARAKGGSSTQILDQQRSIQTGGQGGIDEKIQKLQNILQQAKQNL